MSIAYQMAYHGNDSIFVWGQMVLLEDSEVETKRKKRNAILIREHIDRALAQEKD
ncbi:hypothetical protein LCGC14_0355750 [marine sediment metagenome]|uniref:Uncharacterized protein n=1 Tax=marine sediment metagenome TaxID=412755 RepID=A0A0F9WHI1_9ZZZZ